jgi:hypothetical protein
MNTYTIRSLDASPTALSDAVELLLSNCPSESDRYEKSRLVTELCTVETLPFYRQFYGAYAADGTLIGLV